jgi:nucleotide-binding universal stress UspA family protein
MEDHLSGVSQAESLVLRGDIADEIVKTAAEKNVDLIVMGTHGRKGLEKVLLGSVAERVIKNAPCPVMTVNPYRVK